MVFCKETEVNMAKDSRLCTREYYQRNKEKWIEYREKNREKINERKRIKYVKCREDILKKENDRRKTDEWRKHNNEYQKKHRKTRDARQILRRAVAKGEIIKKLECKWCDSNLNIEAHHEDYSKPLEVIWLCRKCHKNKHFKKGN